MAILFEATVISPYNKFTRFALVSEGDGNDDVDSDSKPAEKSFNERTDDLTAAFGSNKRKQAMSKRHKNRLTDARLKDAVDTAVDRTLGSADIDTLLGRQTHTSVGSSECRLEVHLHDVRK